MTQRPSRRRSGLLKNPSLPGVRGHSPARLGFRNPHARENPFHRAKDGRRPVFERPAIRRRAPMSERGEPALMRTERPPRRNHPRQSRHALFGRAPRVSAVLVGRAPSTARRRRGTGFPGAWKPYVSGEVPAARGIEPLSVRIRGRPRKALRLCAGRPRKVPEPHIVTRSRPYRSLRRSPPADFRGNRIEIEMIGQRRNSRTYGRCEKTAGGAFWEFGKDQRRHDIERFGFLRLFRRGDGVRPRIGRPPRALRPRARPHTQSGAHHRGFGRLRYRRSRARRRSGGIPAEVERKTPPFPGAFFRYWMFTRFRS